MSSRYSELQKRFERLRRGRGVKEGTISFAGGVTRAVRCADPLSLLIAMMNRRWYGKENISPDHQPLAEKYGHLLDLLGDERVESFSSPDHFLEVVGNQVIFENQKGGLPLCQTKTE